MLVGYINCKIGDHFQQNCWCSSAQISVSSPFQNGFCNKKEILFVGVVQAYTKNGKKLQESKMQYKNAMLHYVKLPLLKVTKRKALL